MLNKKQLNRRCGLKTMGFETQFKSGRGVDISEVWWEGVQETQRPKAPHLMVDKWAEEKEW